MSWMELILYTPILLADGWRHRLIGPKGDKKKLASGIDEDSPRGRGYGTRSYLVAHAMWRGLPVSYLERTVLTRKSNDQRM